MCLLLPNHDRCLEVNMDDDEEFMVAWLEEEMFDVAEQNV